MSLNILFRHLRSIPSSGLRWFLFFTVLTAFKSNSRGVVGSSNLGDRLRNAIAGATATASATVNVVPNTCSEVEILDSFVSSSYKKDKHPFYIQGWRWHTLSLVRDAKRLQRLTHRLLSIENSEETKKKVLEKAVSFVVDFNYRGLKGVEQEVFFPWLRDQFSSSNPVHGAIHSLLRQLDNERTEIATIAQKMKEQVDAAARESGKMDNEVLLSLERSLGNWTQKIQHVMDLQDEYIVPVIAISVSAKEQQSLNNRVIRKLGLLNSRIHLVGMYDAVISERSEEQPLFKESIPAIPRYMIPRWKQSLYLPKTDILEDTYPLS